MNRAIVPILLTLLAAALVGLLDAHFHFAQMLRQGKPLEQRELATQFLGAYLAEHYAGKRAIALSNPFTQERGHAKEIYRYEAAGLRGLKQGLAPKVTLEEVVFPEVRSLYRTNPAAVYIDPSTTTPLSYLMADEALDALAQKHRSAGIIVSLIGLPINVLQTQAWRDPAGPKFALLLPDLRVLGDKPAVRAAVVRAAFKSQKIAALILPKPGAPPEDRPLGKDLKAEFDQRFLLVTAENVEAYLKIYPQLF
ncbi:MAG: hypothetical protein HYY24_05250 [Verrucomicrobia bacterium]|nr:hypothetical protein [Verrucomicrobiota bacterium]